MNKITTLAAISMFAVIMGMSAFAPAMAERPATTLCPNDKWALVEVVPTLEEVPDAVDATAAAEADKNENNLVCERTSSSGKMDYKDDTSENLT